MIGQLGHLGPFGMAERLGIDRSLAGADTTVTWWLLTGRWHPVWSQFVLSVVSLADVPGREPARLQFPGATSTRRLPPPTSWPPCPRSPSATPGCGRPCRSCCTASQYARSRRSTPTSPPSPGRSARPPAAARRSTSTPSARASPPPSNAPRPTTRSACEPASARSRPRSRPSPTRRPRSSSGSRSPSSTPAGARPSPIPPTGSSASSPRSSAVSAPSPPSRPRRVSRASPRRGAAHRGRHRRAAPPAGLRLLVPPPPRRSPRRGNQRETRPATDPGEAPTPARRRILTTLVQLETIGVAAAPKNQVALFGGVSPKSSGYQNNLGALRTAGLLDYPGPGLVAITAAGRVHADQADAIATDDELHDQVRALLPPARWRILEPLLAAYPDALERADLADQIDVSPASSGYQNNLGALRSLGLIDYPSSGLVAATPLLFVDG